MALAVVATFIDLQEAHIAAGALRAAGLDADVCDFQFGTVDWMAQNAIGGFRVSVPDAHLPDAVALLTQIRDTAPEPLGLGDRSGYWRTAGGAALIIGPSVLLKFFPAVFPELGWLFARKRPISRDETMGVGLVLGVITALLLAAAFAWRLLVHPRMY